MTGWQWVGVAACVLLLVAFLAFVADTVGAWGAVVLVASLLAVVVFVAGLGLALGGWAP